MCRAPLENGSIEEGSSEEEEDSDFDIDEANQGMLKAAFFGHFNIVCLMFFRGANKLYDHPCPETAFINIKLPKTRGRCEQICDQVLKEI